MRYFSIIRDCHILLMHTVGLIACGVLSGGCSAVGSIPCSSRICVMQIVRDATRRLRITTILRNIDVLGSFRLVLVKQILNQKI